MNSLPIIVGFGGYNASGRSSFHHAYHRTVLDSVDTETATKTLVGLACLMKLVEHDNGQYRDADGTMLSAEEVANKYRQEIEENTLVRRIHKGLFDVDNAPGVRNMELTEGQISTFKVRKRELPRPIPDNWQVKTVDEKMVEVTVDGDMSIKMEHARIMDVQAAGMLPTGFEPGEHYESRFHPRGLKMAVLGASDALNSIGISWNDILSKVDPDQIAVYASSGLGQTDKNGMGGYMQARYRSDRPTSKQMALGLNSMVADFVNAYVCGSVGTTGAMTGACASFLYNLRLGVDDIKAGRHRVVICGASEAPVNPEAIEGFAAMSALATDERLAKLDNAEQADHRRASRPFAENCGFTMGESTQFFVLMDDALVMELGADVHGAVPAVYVNADGHKKSISSPGAGNYITMSKAVAEAASIAGLDTVQKKSFIHAHGSSTPQNRVTESAIFDKVAEGFGIDNWPVTAIKAYVAHPLGPASGDQLSNALGVLTEGVIPGIKTADKVADDVLDDRLDILLADKQAEMDIAFLNSKGFGGNNATGVTFSSRLVNSMLEKRYGEEKFADYQLKREQTRLKAAEYDASANNGQLQVIYHFGQNMINENEIEVNKDGIHIPEFENRVNLKIENRYSDMV